MTKKDYVAIALCLRECREKLTITRSVVDLIAEQLCEVFEDDNQLFDRERFLSAAGVRT